MSLKISTNLSSMHAIGTLKNINRQEEDNLLKLSSSDRIAKAAFDPAGLAISSKMNASIRSAHQAKRNANDGISIFQVAESSLNEIGQIAIRLRELAMQASSDTVDGPQREVANKEFVALRDEVDRMAGSTSFNSIPLLNGTAKRYDIQIGINNIKNEDRLSLKAGKIDATLRGLKMGSVHIASKLDAQNSLGKITKMIDKVNAGRTELGAVMSRIESTIQNLANFTENTEAGKSRIRDADIAKEAATRASLSIRKKAATASLAQANTMANSVTDLV